MKMESGTTITGIDVDDNSKKEADVASTSASQGSFGTPTWSSYSEMNIFGTITGSNSYEQFTNNETFVSTDSSQPLSLELGQDNMNQDDTHAGLDGQNSAVKLASSLGFESPFSALGKPDRGTRSDSLQSLSTPCSQGSATQSTKSTVTTAETALSRSGSSSEGKKAASARCLPHGKSSDDDSFGGFPVSKIDTPYKDSGRKMPPQPSAEPKTPGRMLAQDSFTPERKEASVKSWLSTPNSSDFKYPRKTNSSEKERATVVPGSPSPVKTQDCEIGSTSAEVINPMHNRPRYDDINEDQSQNTFRSRKVLPPALPFSPRSDASPGNNIEDGSLFDEDRSTSDREHGSNQLTIWYLFIRAVCVALASDVPIVADSTPKKIFHAEGWVIVLVLWAVLVCEMCIQALAIGSCRLQMELFDYLLRTTPVVRILYCLYVAALSLQFLRSLSYSRYEVFQQSAIPSMMIRIALDIVLLLVRVMSFHMPYHARDVAVVVVLSSDLCSAALDMIIHKCCTCRCVRLRSEIVYASLTLYGVLVVVAALICLDLTFDEHEHRQTVEAAWILVAALAILCAAKAFDSKSTLPKFDLHKSHAHVLFLYIFVYEAFFKVFCERDVSH